MKAYFLTLSVFFSLSLFASNEISAAALQTQDVEQEATFSTDMNFDQNSDGFVEVEFTLLRAINASEQSEIDELTSENADRLSIEIIGSQIKVRLQGDLSNAGVWNKIFYTIGITQYTFGDSADQIKQPFDVFSNHFNL